jgi:uroporphyrinogen-III synthase
MPRAEIARHETVEILERRGATVVVLPVYRTVPAELDRTVIEDIRRGVDAVLFTSGSTVQHFMNGVRQHAPGFTFPAHTRLLCIGPVTASAAREMGLRVDSVAEIHTADGLVDALVDMCSKGDVTDGE